MSEGALKKRIKADLRWAIESGGHPPFDLGKILDEAKQEFPGFAVGNSTEQVHKELVEKMSQWYFKWFGAKEVYFGEQK